MNIFVQRVQQRLQMCFSRKIFCFILLLLFYNVLFFLYCSIDFKYEYFCTTGNKNFERVFLKFILFELADGISHVLVDRLTWNLEEIFTGCTFVAWTTDFKIWCFVFHFRLPPKGRKAQEKPIFKVQNAAIFLNFRNFAVSVVYAIAIFILIKMHFSFLVSNNQMESRQPFEPVFKNVLYLRLYNFHNFR